MSRAGTIASLATLVRVKGTEVERLEAELARQEGVRARYQASLARLESLAEGSGASGALPPALAANCGHYKQAVFALAELHRNDLHLHEANMAVARKALATAWTRREVLGLVLEQHQDAHRREQERLVRKREDDTATQSWLAGRA